MKINIIGEVEVNFNCGQINHKVKMFVVKDLEYSCVLEVNVLQELNIQFNWVRNTIENRNINFVQEFYRNYLFQVDDSSINVNDASVTNVSISTDKTLNNKLITPYQDINDVLLEYNDIFVEALTNPGSMTKKTGAKYHIEIKEGAVPKISKPYILHGEEKEILRKKINKLLDLKIIEPCKSPWASPVFLVKQNNLLDPYRMVTDFGYVNTATVRDSYPTKNAPLIIISIQLEGEIEMATVVDAKGGFFQLEVDEFSRQYTCIITEDGTFWYVYMGFGGCNSPSAYQREITKSFSPYHDIINSFFRNYVDDFLIFSKKREKHPEELKIIFEIMRKNGILLGTDKCQIAKNEVKFLGYLIGKNGITYDPTKFKLLYEQAPPKNIRELQKFFGFINYFIRFIHNLYVHTRNMRTLLKKGVPYVWTDDMEIDRKKLLDILCKPIHLGFYDPNSLRVLEIDASDDGIGAILRQDSCILGLFNRTLNQTERSYSATEREGLALVEAINNFEPFLKLRHGKHDHFVVVTDHAALETLFEKHGRNKKIDRWRISLSEFKFITVYRPGSLNKGADYLSRCKPNVQQTVSMVVSDSLNNRFIRLWGLQDHTIGNGNSSGLNVNILHTINGIEKRKKKKSKILTHAEEVVRRVLEEVWNKEKKNNSNVSGDILKSVGFNDELEPVYICKEYKNDHYFNNIIQYLRHGLLPKDEKQSIRIIRESEFYCISSDDGLVYHGNIEKDRLELCIPKSLVGKVLDTFHNQPVTGGHTGFKKTYLKIRKHFFWPGMIPDIRSHLKECEKCQLVNRKYGDNSDVTHSIPIISAWHTIAIDFVGPFNESTDGNKFVLTIIDKFTGWVEAFAVPDRSANRVVNLLFNEIICRYGAPECLLSDNGAEFISQIMEELASLYNIKLLHTSTYHPQTNGKNEHFNGVLVNTIKKYVENYMSRSWDKHINSILFVVRSTLNTATGYSPFYLMFGREAAIPHGLVAKVNYENRLILPLADNIVEEFRNNLTRAYHQAKENHLVSQAKQRKYKDKGKNSLVEYKVGDLVLVKGLETKDSDDDELTVDKSNGSNKLKQSWYGPFKVTSVSGKGAYKINAPDRFLERINVSKMKLYHQKKN